MRTISEIDQARVAVVEAMQDQTAFDSEICEVLGIGASSLRGFRARTGLYRSPDQVQALRERRLREDNGRPALPPSGMTFEQNAALGSALLLERQLSAGIVWSVAA